ncbi:geranylgeranylglycerol-phosphate geranylgeranyltransferase [Portibacter marinus]|uniref:geranylgeranylglycerol-phosphate geranylgeranyltransferase n=1 Tax=Portibacter marinus TaxID=2898660 RepID=UPI001F26E7AB|nr:geranylgeranylglycerol-phosphate geranylgeranyltransferase [Portibacter marinus]
MSILRPANLLIIGITMMIFWFFMVSPALIENGVDPSLNTFLFTLLMIMVMMIAGAGYAINDIFDMRADAVNRPAKSLGRKISVKTARNLYLVLNLLAFISATYIFYRTWNFNVLAICAGCILVLWLYSRVLKSTVLMGNVIVSLLIGGVPFIFIFIEQHSLTQLQQSAPSVHQALYIDTFGFAIFAFMANLIREIVKDCEDFEGDLRTGTITIATVLGFKKADYFSIALNIILLILSYIYFRVNRLGHNPIEQITFPLLIWLPLVILAYYLITKERNKRKYTMASRFIKGIMVLGLIYILIHLRYTYA